MAPVVGTGYYVWTNERAADVTTTPPGRCRLSRVDLMSIHAKRRPPEAAEAGDSRRPCLTLAMTRRSELERK